MATNYLEPGALPEGVVVAHTLHGEPDTNVQLAHHVSSSAVEPVPDSGVLYYKDVEGYVEGAPPVPVPRADERAKRCHAKGDTCMGWAITDSPFCAAHAGVFRKSGD